MLINERMNFVLFFFYFFGQTLLTQWSAQCAWRRLYRLSRGVRSKKKKNECKKCCIFEIDFCVSVDCDSCPHARAANVRLSRTIWISKDLFVDTNDTRAEWVPQQDIV